MVEKGKVSVYAASKLARLPPEEQAEVAAQGPKAVKEKATEARKKGAAKPGEPR